MPLSPACALRNVSSCFSGAAFGARGNGYSGRSKLEMKRRAPSSPRRAGDILARLRIGRGGEGDARNIGKALRQCGELQIFRPEIMAPLADAMRLVDGEERDWRFLAAGP